MPVGMKQAPMSVRPHRVNNVTYRAFEVTAHAHALSAVATLNMEQQMPCATRRDIILLSAAILSYQASCPKVYLICMTFFRTSQAVHDRCANFCACCKLGGA